VEDSIVLTDPTRDTPARGSTAAVAGRILRVLVLRPVGTTAALPVVVFAHGYNAEPETYWPLLDAWAQAGYLVAAPELPGSARDLPGRPTRDDIGEAARDLSFVVTALLAGVQGPVDPSRVAAAGHSDGASSVATLAANTAYRDPRIASYLVLSGVIPYRVTDGTWDGGTGQTPLLAMVGTADEYGNLAGSTNLYRQAADPKTLITVPGGDHLNMYIATDADDVRATTTQFLDDSLTTNAKPEG
jgi:alpha-beta hydrolase superfamily lysophospholipase